MPGVNLIGVGGSVYGGPVLCRSLAEARSALSQRPAFLGITSVSLERGLTEVNYFEADQKLIIKQSQRVVLLADSSKLRRLAYQRCTAI